MKLEHGTSLSAKRVVASQIPAYADSADAASRPDLPRPTGAISIYAGLAAD